MGARGLTLMGAPVPVGGGGGGEKWYLAPDLAVANCLAAYKAIGAADIATSYVNLVTPGTYNLAAVNAAPTFDAATGWTFNGSTQTLDTGITPQTGWSWLVRYSGCTAESNNIFFGANEPSKIVGFTPNRATVGVRFYYGGTLDRATGVAAGVLAVANNKAYIDGIEIAGTISSLAATAAYTLYLGGANGATIQRRAGVIQAAAIYNTALTPTQIATITARMQALPL